MGRAALTEVDPDEEPVVAGLLHERVGRFLWMLAKSWTDILEHCREGVRLVPPEYREPSARVEGGAYGVVRSFERAGFLLRHGDRDAFTAGPRWVADRMLVRARQSLVEGGAVAWGEALLSPESAPSIGRLLLARVLDGDFDPL